MQSPRFGLPDQGQELIDLAEEVAGPYGAATVEAEVRRVRRPSGVLVSVDVSSYSKLSHGPLFLLGPLLGLESLTAGVWAADGFGMFQKRSARKQVEHVCRRDGLDAAVEWAFTNSTNHRLDASVLADMLTGARLRQFNPGFLESEMARALHKWRRSE